MNDEHAILACTPRALRDEEIEHLHEHGWARLEALIEPEIALAALERSRRFVGRIGVDTFLGEDIDLDTVVADYHHPSREDDLLNALATHRVLGEHAAVLLGEPGRQVRLLADTLVGSFPPGHLTYFRDDRAAVEATDFHQGQPFIPFDRRAVSFRISLHATAATAMPMRFLSGSHRCGLLGRAISASPGERWPSLAGCALSAPFALEPGDATVHLSDLVRGYPPRGPGGTARGYVLVYLPATACFTGMPSSLTDGLGLTPLAPVPAEHPAFPLVGHGQATRSG